VNQKRGRVGRAYGERSDSDVISGVVSECDEVTLVGGQVRVYGGERVVATLKVERDAGGTEAERVKTVVPQCRVERQTAVAELSVRSTVLAL